MSQIIGLLLLLNGSLNLIGAHYQVTPILGESRTGTVTTSLHWYVLISVPMLLSNSLQLQFHTV